MASAAEIYQTNRAVSTSPISRLLTVYDYALRACENQKPDDLAKTLRVLTESLDFTYPVAANLAALYQWCGELGRRKQYHEAARLLGELRNAWAEASKNREATAAATQRFQTMENITAVV